MNWTHLFLTVKTQTPDKFGVLYRLVTYEFHGFTSSINSKGYHPLVPGLISIFRDGMGPFKDTGTTF